MKAKAPIRWLIALLLAVAFVGVSYAYVQWGPPWPSSTTTFYVKYDNGTYDTAFIEAMNKWNGLSNFSFSSNTSTYVDPCNSVSSPDYLNSYNFSSNNCDRGWGGATLAVCYLWYSGSTRLDTDVIFNSNRSWGVHDGTTTSPYDFKRVAVHEVGHALGLGHETTNTAIMNPYYSTTIIGPQTDDINGLVALYGGTTPTPTDQISLRAYNGQYLIAEGGGGDLVYANRDAIGAWEKFELVDLGSNMIALKAYNGQYLVAEGGGGDLVYANRDAIGTWEKFEKIVISSSTLSEIQAILEWQLE
ncbi:MAG: matrixin family metalloprotease [Desulfobacterales bacterium]|nr:hypothetical protein [Desulfobacter sp.]MDP6681942.1 matrixin family metalloprotease [Desulfobacterales bacterium]MDP6808349.1 matrixin family metalloprotease [Desulfobacterales bacterium]